MAERSLEQQALEEWETLAIAIPERTMKALELTYVQRDNAVTTDVQETFLRLGEARLVLTLLAHRLRAMARTQHG